MGRRKIEIKAIKDDRNRSVTFLKRKGGLFKKAHELSVLCSVDVAVFIFGNNKKLYEYSSSDMRQLIAKYQFHGVPNEHKGPSDFNGGDDDDDDDGDGTPPRGHEGSEHQMMPPQFHGHGHSQPPFAHIRHHTPSASPPVPNGGPFQAHPGHPGPRGSTPQPPMGSRPGSRNDMRRMAPSSMVPQPHGAHPGITYMPTPPIYQGSNQPGMMGPQPAGQYPYAPQHQHHPQHHHHQQQQQQQQQQHQSYVDDRRPSAPPAYAPQPPPHAIPVASRPEPSPPHTGSHQQPLAPQHSVPHISPPPQPDRRPQDPPPPPRVEPKTEPLDRQPLGLNTDIAIKKLPQRKSHSIFTPIEENRSILSQHLASFASESQGIKTESNRSQSVDASSRGGPSASPQLKRSSTQNSLDKARAASVSSGPESAFTPPSRSNSLKIGGPGGGSRPRGPRLTVQIPDGASEPGSAGGESNSPHNPTITPTQAPRHNSVVLPPPSPSASALLSAGATGPPNPFARPPPQQNVNGETPVSALPSRFLGHELLPSPGSFYQDWNFRGNDSNTLPSPLNFATPVVGTGPSFLRDDHHGSGANNNSSTSNNSSGSTASTAATTTNTTATSGTVSTSVPLRMTKRKSPEFGGGGHGESQEDATEAKRLKVEYT
ncbi:SRF-type transcription factor family protein [Metarhizium robertsii]|uniref:MADS-box MEF2 type transcription factor MIG1 n=1 Tax=Metarhizium robertsii TaxID=568076 RepID=A0A0A1UNR3_9HYPO|nr:SRF-type transcription factor family protein [Metarhizium robertsii]